MRGLAMYRQHALTKVPASCIKMKQDLVHEKDDVGRFLTDVLQKTDDKADFVTSNAVWLRFVSEHRDLQRDKKTAIDRTTFKNVLQKVCGQHNLKALHKDKTRRNHREVYLTWLLKDDQE